MAEVTTYTFDQRPPMREEDKDMTRQPCEAESPPAPFITYWCTRNIHHDGPHEASGIDQGIIASWTDEKEKEA